MTVDGPEDVSPDELLERHERELSEWLAALRERRDRLAELDEEFAAVDREDLPADLAESLSELLASLQRDLDAQVADLEGDVEAIRDLRATLDGVSGEAVTAELHGYVATMDGVFEDKRATVERLVTTTDRLIDRYERVIAGR
ncbi:hypothetical protein BRD00_01070 [Halobacteriales archaeon QS_8_69_26]|nr:MAG: hypothetical protein BRD00_01070 [Halobacteriales archaeon QS_8_69_26]